MLKLKIGLLLLAMAGGLRAQTVTVRDARSGETLPGVSLISEAPRAQTVTNARGIANVSAFKKAREIEIRSIGYLERELSYAELQALKFEIRLEPSVLNLDEVVVSATRWRENSRFSPVSIASISPREMQLQNPQTAADLLGLSDQVFIQKSQQGGGSPMIRGYSTSRLMYSVDGVRMNNAIFRQGNLQNVISLDPWAIENTEVLFGPGAVLYGSDAIGGVMSFQTLQPQLAISDSLLITGKAISRYANASQERSGHFDVNIGGQKWAAVTSVSQYHFDHLRQGRHGPDDYLRPFVVQRIDSLDRQIRQEDPLLQKPSGYRQSNVMQKVLFRPNQHWEFQYAFHWSETSEYGRYDRHQRQRDGLPRHARWDFGPQQWMMNHFSLSHQQSQGLYDQMKVSLAQQFFGESRITRNWQDPIEREQEERVQAYSANVDWVKNLGERQSLFYGVEYVLNQVASTAQSRNILNGEGFSAATRYPQADWYSSGAYLQYEFRQSPRLTWQSGLRYSLFGLEADFRNPIYNLPFSEASLQEGALTGSLGAVYRPGGDWLLKANFGTGFRAPNVDDIGKVFDSEPGAVTVPNPALKAEYAYNLDLGLAKVIGGRLKLEASLYYSILDQAMVRRNSQLNGRDSLLYEGVLSQVQSIQNAAEARRYGLQAGLELQLPAGFSLSSRINWQEGSDELDDGSLSPPRHAAPLFGATRLHYRQGALHLQLYALYQAERRHEDLSIEEQSKTEIYALDAQGRSFAPAWYTLNFKMQYRFSRLWSLTAGLENITDQRYRPYSSGLSGPGRNFILALRADF